MARQAADSAAIREILDGKDGGRGGTRGCERERRWLTRGTKGARDGKAGGGDAADQTPHLFHHPAVCPRLPQEKTFHILSSMESLHLNRVLG